MISNLLVLWFLGLVVVSCTPLAIFCKIHKKKQNKIKDLYIDYGIKANAYILKKQHYVLSTRGSGAKYVLDVCFDIMYGDIKCKQYYTVRSNNSKIKLYDKQIQVLYIPQYFEYENRLRTKEEFYKILGCKIDLNASGLYPMVIFADDINS